jgi:hypothetical protein
MAIKLGPLSLSFKTDVKREEGDEAARRATLSAKAREARGRGNASAKQLASNPEEAAAVVEAQSRPVGGLRLGLGALWRSFVRLFRRR